MVKIRTLSISEEQDAFLESIGLSASKLFQEKLEELRRGDETKKELFKRIEALAQELRKRINFINERKLMADYEAWLSPKDVKDV